MKPVLWVCSSNMRCIPRERKMHLALKVAFSHIHPIDILKTPRGVNDSFTHCTSEFSYQTHSLRFNMGFLSMSNQLAPSSFKKLAHHGWNAHTDVSKSLMKMGE